MNYDKLRQQRGVKEMKTMGKRMLMEVKYWRSEEKQIVCTSKDKFLNPQTLQTDRYRHLLSDFATKLVLIYSWIWLILPHLVFFTYFHVSLHSYFRLGQGKKGFRSSPARARNRRKHIGQIVWAMSRKSTNIKHRCCKRVCVGISICLFGNDC